MTDPPDPPPASFPQDLSEISAFTLYRPGPMPSYTTEGQVLAEQIIRDHIVPTAPSRFECRVLNHLAAPTAAALNDLGFDVETASRKGYPATELRITPGLLRREGRPGTTLAFEYVGGRMAVLDSLRVWLGVDPVTLPRRAPPFIPLRPRGLRP